MKFFEKMRKFIKRIFIDYNFINQIIENSSVKYLEQINNDIRVATNNIEDKIENEIKKNIENKIEAKVAELNNNFNEISNKNIESIKNDIYIINNDIEQIKSENIEIQNIKYDENKKNILIAGFYGAPNLGDELMLETVLEYLEAVPNTRITILLANNPEYDIDKYKDVRFIHYPKALCDFNIIAEKYDYFIFGGGAIISDKNFKKEHSYQYDLATILIKLSIRAIAFNKKVLFLGLSASSRINDTEYLEKLEYVIRNSYYFSVRDIYTKNFLIKEMGQDIEKYIIYNYDILLANKKIYNKIGKTSVNDEFNIGIVWIANDNDIEKLEQTADNINKYMKTINKKCNINLIPFYEYCKIDTKFYNQMLNKQYSNLKINIEKYPNNTQKTIEIMSKNNIIIGLRYHSILIAHALAIPCIPICYDINEEYEYKIKHLNEMLKKEEALSYKNIDFNGLIEQIKLAKNIDTNILRAIAIKIEEASQKQMLEIVNKLLKDDD